MSERMMALMPYIIVFSTFNIAISIIYYFSGLITYKKLHKKIRRTKMSKGRRKYLQETKFVNVQRKWIKIFYLIFTYGSLSYFIISEILCFGAVYLTGKCILVCRISFFVAITLLLLLIILLVYVNKKNAKLAEVHQENLKKAFDEYEKLKYSERAEYEESEESREECEY